MKDVNKLKDYRLKYKRYFNIDFSNNYVIHHIDLNHNNNDINNLVLLPKKLHTKYHLYLDTLKQSKLPNMLITGNGCNNQNYYIGVMEDFLKVLHECNKWFDFKTHLEGYMPNVHNIKLEDLKK